MTGSTGQIVNFLPNALAHRHRAAIFRK